jgi:16S rRNA (cytosine967-C5)-methyltransferase
MLESKSASRQIAPPLCDSLYVAAEVLASVIAGRTPEASLAAVPAALRPATMDLVHTALRDYGHGDFLLARLMSKPLSEDVVRGLLLATLPRLAARPQEAHTTVDQAVEAAKRMVNGRFKGVVNGVLRSYLRQHAEIEVAAHADPVARWRHPAWWIARVQRDHPQHQEQILAAGNTHPPMGLRVNRRRVASADFLHRLSTEGIAAHMVGDYALILERPLPVSRIPGFAEGLVSVQDYGAQQAATLLDVQDGMRVLDACAAPGGKAAHVLELADVNLIALDADRMRNQRIGETLLRLGLQAEIRVGDARNARNWWDGVAFDRILADVPCSASGVVRRHPDVKWLRRESDIAGFARQQADILESLWRTLAPGGKMLYATCSVFAEENSLQIAAFVGRHADARCLPTGGFSTELSLLPNADHDGFFYALLQKA